MRGFKCVIGIVHARIEDGEVETSHREIWGECESTSSSKVLIYGDGSLHDGEGIFVLAEVGIASGEVVEGVGKNWVECIWKVLCETLL